METKYIEKEITLPETPDTSLVPADPEYNAELEEAKLKANELKSKSKDLETACLHCKIAMMVLTHKYPEGLKGPEKLGYALCAICQVIKDMHPSWSKTKLIWRIIQILRFMEKNHV